MTLRSKRRTSLSCALLFLTASAPAWAQSSLVISPYNGSFIPSGLGLTKNIPASMPLVAPPWTMQCWVRFESAAASTLVAGFGQRYFAVLDHKLALWFGPGESVASSAAIETGNWHLLAAAFDGVTAVLYEDGKEIASKAAKLTVLDAAGQRVLPAYYSDNYVSLLPGETRDIRIDCPHPGASPLEIGLRGWNVRATTIRLNPPAVPSTPVPRS